MKKLLLSIFLITLIMATASPPAVIAKSNISEIVSINLMAIEMNSPIVKIEKAGFSLGMPIAKEGLSTQKEFYAVSLQATSEVNLVASNICETAKSAKTGLSGYVTRHILKCPLTSCDIKSRRLN